MINKYLPIIIVLILFSCTTNNVFNEYINNNNISALYSTDDSKYIGIDFETFDLSSEQKDNLMYFIETFQSSKIYIKNINYKSLVKYDVMKIDLAKIDVIGFNNEKEYGIYCIFYSKNKITEYSKFDNTENLWLTFNIALYQFNNNKLEFNGWHY